MGVVLPAVEVPAVVVPVVVVPAVVVESKLIAALEVVRDRSKLFALLSAAAN
jgi:hypothetical protein